MNIIFNMDLSKLVFIVVIVKISSAEDPASKTKSGSPELNALNVTFPHTSTTSTTEVPIPILVTTLSPKQLQIKTKRRSAGLLRRAAKDRSTSSSSGEKSKSGKDGEKKGTREKDLSLEMSSMSDIPSEGEVDRGTTKKGQVKSSNERKGWRKWHRKCQGCPDIRVKWREPKVAWICGAYQRARRSFKSECVMHYRNCQDGTMFVKIADHRCPDDSPTDPFPHGDHFFYEYKVAISGETSKSSSKDKSASTGNSATKELDTFSVSGSIESSESERKVITKKPRAINYRRRKPRQ